jgi:hypothetical protein
MFKKAQAAMEFLMTYGWAILVVLAAIGALAYFGILSPGNLLPQKCEFQAGLDCTEHPDASESTGVITFPIVNSMGYRITVDSVVSGSCTGAGSTIGVNGAAPVALPGDLANGEPGTIALGGCTLTEGERYNEVVTISYTSNATGMVHSATGTVAGKVRA